MLALEYLGTSNTNITILYMYINCYRKSLLRLSQLVDGFAHVLPVQSRRYMLNIEYTYSMSSKSFPIFPVNSLYEQGQDLLSIQYTFFVFILFCFLWWKRLLKIPPNYFSKTASVCISHFIFVTLFTSLT